MKGGDIMNDLRTQIKTELKALEEDIDTIETHLRGVTATTPVQNALSLLGQVKERGEAILSKLETLEEKADIPTEPAETTETKTK